MRFFSGTYLTRKGSSWKRLQEGLGKRIRVVTLAQDMLRRHTGNGQGEGIEPEREAESLLQAESSEDHTRTKESPFLHGAPPWPVLWAGVCRPQPPFRTFWGNMAALLGSLQVLQLLQSLLLCQRRPPPPPHQGAPHSNADSLLLCTASGGFEVHLSREKFPLGDQFSLCPTHSSLNFL